MDACSEYIQHNLLPLRAGRTPIHTGRISTWAPKRNQKLKFHVTIQTSNGKSYKVSWPVSAPDIQPNFPCSFSAHLFVDKPSSITVNNPLLSWDSEWKGNMSLCMTERTAKIKMLVRIEFLAYVSFGVWIAPGFSNRGHVPLGHQVRSDCIFQ